MNSATTTAITLMTAEIFAPLKINGSALGNRAFTLISKRFADKDRISSYLSLSSERNPWMALTVSGANVIRMIITTFDSSP